ncbi:unnamed protein product [Moneuplotes crassus]|uniref:VWFA domain-containing protein n=1 Tax=Euplotes crassus TaxID=5936 RepID=A0AAD1U8B8_EUPCR|nr:unnamed protein product [Moneuplotes crassus]
MDFDENIAELEKNTQLHGSQDEIGFGLNSQELRELEHKSDAVIFAIDCRSSMFVPNDYNDSGLCNFSTVIKAATGFLKSKIVSSNSDQTGIILYNCSKSLNSMNFESVYVLNALDRPNAENIKSLESLIDTENIRFSPSDEETHLSELLWTCDEQFTTLKEIGSPDGNSQPTQTEISSYSKRIFLFTNEENPMSNSPRGQEESIERAQKLVGNGIEIELFPMSHPQEDKTKFDVDIFFSNILKIDDNDFESAYLRIQDLSKRIRLKEFKKRVLGKCMFSVAGSMNVGLKFYTLTKKTTKPSAKFIKKATGKELKSLTRYICKESGNTLYRSQIGTHYPLKNKKVIITEKDMKKIKHFEEPGMKLIGFKSRYSIHIYQNVRPPYFIYPDENTIKGSSQMFHAMIESLVKKDKVAYVRFIPREGAMVRFCYLIPQKEQGVKEGSEEYLPPGFHLIFAPYAEDIREIENELSHDQNLKEPCKSETKIAKIFVKNMTIDFNSRNFENPSIQKFYSGLQSIALDQKDPEQIQDSLEPDQEGMKAMEQVFQNMKEEFELGKIQKKVPAAPKAKRKRKDDIDADTNKSDNNSDVDQPQQKKVKKSDKEYRTIEVPKVYTDKQLSDMIKKNEMIDLSVMILRQACDQRHISYKKKDTKRALIKALTKFIKDTS